MPCDLTYPWDLKSKTKQNRNKLTDTEDILMAAGWEQGWGVGEKGDEIKHKRAVTK